MFKVLFPFIDKTVGGSHVSSMELAEALRIQGLSVVMATATNSRNAALFSKKGLRVVEYIPNSQSLDNSTSSLKNKMERIPAYFSIIKNAYKILSREKPDVVHVNDDASVIIWGVACKALRIPLVWHVRQEVGKRFLDRIRVGVSSAILFNSSGCKMIRLPQVKKFNQVIYNPISIPSLSKPETEYFRRKLKIPSDSIIICCIANLSKRKRIEWVCQLATVLSSCEKKVDIIIAGEDQSDGEYVELISKTQKLLSGSCDLHYVGATDTPAKLMASGDIFVLPSKIESFGRVYAEAQALGVPTIGCRVGGVPEVVIHNKTGFVVDTFQEFVDYTVKLIEDPVMRKKMGQAGQTYVQSNFDPSSIALNLIHFYRKVVDRVI